MEKTIFEYLDYREYLKDFYDWKKNKYSFYSYRLFSQKAGFKSPNFLKLVIDGKRNLTKESVFRFSKALNLNKSETDYFENIVFLNQCRSLDEKNAYLCKIMRHRVKCDPKKIEESQYEYYSQWYHPVIRELVTAVDFGDDFKRLASLVIPSITVSEAKRSVDLLLKLNYIRKNDHGNYEKISNTLTTGPQVRSVAVSNFHKSMIKLGSDAIERFPSKLRNISSLTLSVSEDTCSQVISKIETFRKELLDLAEADSEPSKVLQLNMQLFPLSDNFDKGGDR
ncbi:TIGR02147 family protein [Chitinispirillales bacterium ANBcel5]|uniref:TIGR02147 family protein n=1 Tax=Cellulosispirillum alkaliphilum TaxID=3039283 RepID=UPI002A527079|nr:TIGR02147 family protein [Chitinispirillales bacterium ANBcel5]